MSEHIDVEELADAAEGLLTPSRADTVRRHLESCRPCRETSDLLSTVSATLAAEPRPTMPAAVSARLDAVIADEQTRRALKTDVPAGAGGPGTGTSAGSGTGSGTGTRSGTVLDWTPRPRLAPPPPRGAHRGRSAGWILAAAAAATLVGFGGYVVSARAGLNEPPGDVAAVSSSSLPKQAGALERSRDLDPHRFSQAWSCARKVTDGRITGLASVTWNGQPALLVYLRPDPEQRVVVVVGCEQGTPAVADTAVLR